MQAPLISDLFTHFLLSTSALLPFPLSVISLTFPGVNESKVHVLFFPRPISASLALLLRQGLLIMALAFTLNVLV